MPPKQLSGAAKNKKRKLDNEIRESQRGDLNKYLIWDNNSSVHPGQDDGDIEVNEHASNNSN